MEVGLESMKRVQVWCLDLLMWLAILSLLAFLVALLLLWLLVTEIALRLQARYSETVDRLIEWLEKL
jgi:hypothetical protein